MRGRIVGTPPIRRVLVLAVDGVQSLDVMGPIETFCDANDQVPGTYRIDVVGPAHDGHITMSNGLKLGVDPLPEPPRRVDTLVVAGGEGARRAGDDPAIVDWIARASRRPRRTSRSPWSKRTSARKSRCRSPASWSCSSNVPAAIAVQRRPVGPAGLAAGAA